MLTGEYNHTIDPKGRVIIPAKLREKLGDRFYVTKGLDGCLFVFDEQEWKVFEEKLGSLPLSNNEARIFVRFFLSGVIEAEIDKQGRITLPANLREHAELEKDVVLVGAARRAEIWSKARWDNANATIDADEIAKHMQELGI